MKHLNGFSNASSSIRMGSNDWRAILDSSLGSSSGHLIFAGWCCCHWQWYWSSKSAKWPLLSSSFNPKNFCFPFSVLISLAIYHHLSLCRLATFPLGHCQLLLVSFLLSYSIYRIELIKGKSKLALSANRNQLSCCIVFIVRSFTALSLSFFISLAVHLEYD